MMVAPSVVAGRRVKLMVTESALVPRVRENILDPGTLVLRCLESTPGPGNDDVMTCHK